MKSLYIKLTNNPRLVTVDKEDFSYLNRWKWHYHNGYAVRTFEVGDFTKFIFMHSVVTGTYETMKVLEIDHANGNTLDNRKDNLRLVTRGENGWNSAIRKDNTSGYKGVAITRNGKFQAQIGFKSKRKYLGTFATAAEAAKTYNEAAREMFGLYARLNTIEELEQLI